MALLHLGAVSAAPAGATAATMNMRRVASDSSSVGVAGRGRGGQRRQVARAPLSFSARCSSAPRRARRAPSRGAPARGLAVRVAAATTAAECDEGLMRAYQQALLDAKVTETATELRQSQVRGNGIFLTKDVAMGDTLMRIDTDVCIIVQRDPKELHTTSWRAPNDGTWNRVESALAVHASTGLPWDLMCALCLVDAAEGSGGAFYGNYQQVLPRIADLQVPFCLRPSVVDQLQNPEVETGARGQKERLTLLFPQLMPDEEDEEEDGPGLLQWAYACVRSRAFFLGNDYFAFIPFLDMANHSEKPNAAYRPTPDGDTIDIVAMTDIKAGSELFISYTGGDVDAYTSNRLMAQYGFVLTDGSIADRLPLAKAVPTHLKGVAFPIAKVQETIGDVDWIGMMSRKRNHLYSAVKSIPTSPDEETIMGTEEEQTELAQALLAECERALAAFPTSIEEDKVLLATANMADDMPLAGAIEFRMQQKLVWEQGKIFFTKYLNQ